MTMTMIIQLQKKGKKEKGYLGTLGLRRESKVYMNNGNAGGHGRLYKDLLVSCKATSTCHT